MKPPIGKCPRKTESARLSSASSWGGWRSDAMNWAAVWKSKKSRTWSWMSWIRPKRTGLPGTTAITGCSTSSCAGRTAPMQEYLHCCATTASWPVRRTPIRTLSSTAPCGTIWPARSARTSAGDTSSRRRSSALTMRESSTSTTWDTSAAPSPTASW